MSLQKISSTEWEVEEGDITADLTSKGKEEEEGDRRGSHVILLPLPSIHHHLSSIKRINQLREENQANGEPKRREEIGAETVERAETTEEAWTIEEAEKGEETTEEVGKEAETAEEVETTGEMITEEMVTIEELREAEILWKWVETIEIKKSKTREELNEVETLEKGAETLEKGAETLEEKEKGWTTGKEVRGRKKEEEEETREETETGSTITTNKNREEEVGGARHTTTTPKEETKRRGGEGETEEEEEKHVGIGQISTISHEEVTRLISNQNRKLSLSLNKNLQGTKKRRQLILVRNGNLSPGMRESLRPKRDTQVLILNASPSPRSLYPTIEKLRLVIRIPNLNGNGSLSLNQSRQRLKIHPQNGSPRLRIVKELTNKTYHQNRD